MMSCIYNGIWITNYSGDMKSEHLKSGLWRSDFKRSGFQMVWFSSGRALAMAIVQSFGWIKTTWLLRCLKRVIHFIVPTKWKPDHWKSWHFCSDFKWFLTKCDHFSEFQMVGLPDFRSSSKSKPFATQPLFDPELFRFLIPTVVGIFSQTC